MKKEEESASISASYTATFTRTDQVSFAGTFYIHNKTQKIYKTVSAGSSVTLPVNKGDWIYFGISYSSYSTKSMWLYIKGFITGDYARYYGWNEMYFQWDVAQSESLIVGTWSDTTTPYLVTYDANGGSLEAANSSTKNGDLACWFESNQGTSGTNRKYRKESTEKSYLGWGQINGGWMGIINVGKTAESVRSYTEPYDSHFGGNAYDINGEEWYAAVVGPGYQGYLDRYSPSATERVGSFIPLWKEFSNSVDTDFAFDSTWSPSIESARQLLEFHKNYCYVFNLSGNIRFPSTAPTRKGYMFKGWYTARSGGTKVTSTRALSGNVTYYAQWTPNSYTLTLDPGIGTTSVLEDYGYNNSDARLCTLGGRNYYKLHEEPAIVVTVPGSVRLISTNAKAAEYKCEACPTHGGGQHHADPGTGAVANRCELFFDQLSGRYLAPNDDGYYYYYNESTNTYTAVPEEEVDENYLIRLYTAGMNDGHGMSTYVDSSRGWCHADPAACNSLTYSDGTLNKGSLALYFLAKAMGMTTKKTMTFGSAYGALPEAYAFGHVFAGWWTGDGTNGDWGVQVKSTDQYSTLGTQTLHARYTPNTYTLEYNANGGEMESEFSFNDMKRFDDAGSIIMLMRDGNTQDPRFFYKTYAGESYVAMLVRNGTVSEDGEVWVSPIMFAKDTDALGYHVSSTLTWNWENADSDGKGSVEIDGEMWYYLGAGLAYTSAISHIGYINDMNGEITTRLFGEDIHDAVANFVSGKTANYQFGKTKALSSPKARKGYHFEGWWTKDGSLTGEWGTQITSQTPLYWLGGEIVNVQNSVYYTQSGTCTYSYSKIEPLTLYAKWSVKSAETVRVAMGLSGSGPSEGLVDESFMWVEHSEYENAYMDIVPYITPYAGGLTEVDYEKVLTNVACDFGVSLNGIFANSGYRFAGINVSTSGYDWSLPSMETWKSEDSCVSFVPEISGATYYVSLVFEETAGKLLYSNGIQHYFLKDESISPRRQSNGLWKVYEGSNGLAVLRFYAEKSGDIVLEVTDGVSDIRLATWLEVYLNGNVIIQTGIDDETVDIKIENVAAGWNELFIYMDAYADLLMRISDESDVGSGYFYFEDGVYPQTYVGEDENEAFEGEYAAVGGDEAIYRLNLGGQDRPVYDYHGVKAARVIAPKTANGYVKGNAYWFKLEPIRWRVTPLGAKVGEVPEKFADAGWKNQTFQVVSDKVLDYGCVNANGVVGGGWSYKNSDMYEKINANYGVLSSTFGFADSGSWRFDSTSTTGVSGGIITGSNNKVVSAYNNVHTGLLQASVQDVDKLYQDNYNALFASDEFYYHNNTNLDESKRSAYASDLVVMLSGKSSARFAEYGTRDLYNGANNFNIASSGYKKNVWLNGSSGVRFSYAYRQNQEKAKLVSGQEFNAKIKSLVTNSVVAYGAADTTVTKIVFDYLDEKGEYVIGGIGGSFNVVSSGYVDVSANQDESIIACYDDNAHVDGHVVYVLSRANIFANEDASYMFSNLQTVTEIVFDNFSTVNVTNMRDMFAACYVLESFNVSLFDTSNVTNLNGMFKNCRVLTALDVASWDVRKVTTMKSVFDNCYALTSLNLSGWKVTNKLKDMYSMFNDCVKLTMVDLTDWDTSEVENMQQIFGGCKLLSNIKGLSDLNVEKVKYMGGMFLGCSALTRLDLSKWQTNALTSVTIYDEGRASWDGMFKGCSALQEIKFGEGFKVDKVTRLSNLFYDCNSLKSLNIKNWNVSNVTSFSALFRDCNSLEEIDLTGWDTSSAIYMNAMFQYCYNMKEIKGLEGFVASNVTYMSYMFYQCYSLTSVDVSRFDTAKVRGMVGMFWDCRGLKTLNVSNFDTSNVENMEYMFYYCKNLTSLNVSNFNMSKVINVRGMFRDCRKLQSIQMFDNATGLTDMSQMFMGCYKLKNIDLSAIDTSNVTDMHSMFSCCCDLEELDVSHFDTSNVTDMSYMFNECNELRTLNLSNFDTSNVTSMASMFYSCDNLYHIDMSGWDTSKVTSMYQMFAYCNLLQSLDLSSFDTSKVTDMYGMFYDCLELRTIYASDLWSNVSVSSGDSMFYRCTGLVGGNGTACTYWGEDEYIDYNYAQIDTAATPGYFTRKTVVVDCQELRESFLNYEFKDLSIGVKFSDEEMLDVTIYDTFGPNGEVVYGWYGSNYYLISDYEIWLSGDATELFHLPGLTRYSTCSVTFANVNTSLITNMKKMFMYDGEESGSFVIFINEEEMFDTSNVTDMSYMFAGANVSNLAFSNGDWSVFDTSKVTTMKGMFENSYVGSELWLTSFDTSNVIDMSEMFYNSQGLSIVDLSSFDTSNVEDMVSMFELCVGLEQIYVGEKWTMENVMLSLDMFNSCWELYGDKGTVFESSYDGGTYARIDGGTANPGYLSSKTRGTTLVMGPTFNNLLPNGGAGTFLIFDYFTDVNEYYFGGLGNMLLDPEDYVDVSFWGDGSIRMYQNLQYTMVLSYGKIMANENCVDMFFGSDYQNIIFNNFDTSNVTDMSCMFYSISNLTTLDLSGFDSANVKNIDSMFVETHDLQTIYVSELWQLDYDWFDINPSNGVFTNCYSLVGGNGLTYDNADVSWHYACIDGGSKYGYGYFTYKAHS